MRCHEGTWQRWLCVMEQLSMSSQCYKNFSYPFQNQMLYSFDVFSPLSPLLGRSHWYIAVICFPWLEEAVYEECPHQNSLHHQPQQSPLRSESENSRTDSVLAFPDNCKDEEEMDANRSLFSKGR